MRTRRTVEVHEATVVMFVSGEDKLHERLGNAEEDELEPVVRWCECLCNGGEDSLHMMRLSRAHTARHGRICQVVHELHMRSIGQVHIWCSGPVCLTRSLEMGSHLVPNGAWAKQMVLKFASLGTQ